MSSFWENLPKPFFVLAPMADVTDCAFRALIAKYSRPAGPQVFWTEFVSADGLASAGREKLLPDLRFSSAERPIVAQLFGSNPKNMEIAGALVKELNFDGLDLNMGCPDKSIEKQGAGAAHIKYSEKNWQKAKEIIEAARSGAKNLSVSVKTRLGYNQISFDWLSFLLSQNLPALTIHLRTRKEMSLVPAHWELMPQIVALRNKISPQTKIIGNGDVLSVEQGRRLAKESGCDGLMIGRGIFGTPWFFENLKIEKTPKERLEIMLKHIALFEEMLGGLKNFAIMKKHYKAYANGFDGAKELRLKLMETGNFTEAQKIVSDFLTQQKV